MKAYWVSGLSAAILALGSLPAVAQPVISAKSGLISYVEGKVTLNGDPVDFSTTHFQDVKENSIVQTGDGRTEVLLTPGVTLRLSENSSLRMITNRLIDTRVEVLTGSAVVEADEIMKDNNVTVVCKNANVMLAKAGIYRFNSEPAEVKVFKGVADVAINGETTPVSSGRSLNLGGEVASVQKFDENDTDSLDHWSHRRGSYLAMANASAANGLIGSGYMPSTWGMNGCSAAWGYNSWLGMMTFIPCNGMLMSPYGYQFWSPFAVNRAFWGGSGFFGGGGVRPPVGGSSTGLSAGSLTRPAASVALSRGSSSAVSSAAAASGSHGSVGGMGNSGGGFASGGFNGGGGGASAGGGGFGGGGASAGGGGHSGGGGGGGAGHH